MNRYDEAMQHLEEKLGHKDGLISLSTIALEPGANGQCRPAARIVDAYYEDGAFYTVTNLRSGKMAQIAENSEVAICPITENFTANGIGENLGWVCDEQNAAMMAKLRVLFAAWYHLANNDSDPNTVLLRVRMTKGVWFDGHKGIRNEIDFINRTAD
jgi:uncharacterized pyridoxamine 5'-phosphate oxidase family protein